MSLVLRGPYTFQIYRPLRSYRLTWQNDHLCAFRIILLARDTKEMKSYMQFMNVLPGLSVKAKT